MPLYVRIDLVTGTDGAPLLIELEAAEPFFFLDMVSDAAADRFIASLVHRLDDAAAISDLPHVRTRTATAAARE